MERHENSERLVNTERHENTERHDRRMVRNDQDHSIGVHYGRREQEDVARDILRCREERA